METGSTKGKHKAKKTHLALWIILGVLVLALLAGGIFVWHVLKKPEALFDNTVVRQTETATPAATPVFDIDAYLPTAEPGATPVPTFAAEPTVQPEPESEPVSGIVNIALFGIDAYEDDSSTSGSMPHTDANLIVAVNFDTKEVSLISIARDSFTTAPGHTGFYKFNGIFNVGGGMDDPKAGFELSCRAAEQWLGGVSVPYYYGVDFQAVIDLVDMLGGIDFDVDITLYTLDKQTIRPGHRHLDGQGVMAYLRMRSTAGGLDSKRTERQRKMMIAIFQKLKSEGKLGMIPDLLKTMGNNVYTNTTLAQTAALANFAQGIDADSIRSYSIQGSIHMSYDWAFCFIDQQARIDLLKTVYGIDAAPIGCNSRLYEKYLHDSGFDAIKYLTITNRIFTKVHETSADAMTEDQKAAYAKCWQDYQNLQAAFNYIDQWTQARCENNRKLDDAEKKEQADCYQTLRTLESELKKSANTLNEAFGSPVKASWSRSNSQWYEKNSDINDTYVDFR